MAVWNDIPYRLQNMCSREQLAPARRLMQRCCSLRILAGPCALEGNRFLSGAVDLCQHLDGVLQPSVVRRDAPEAQEEQRDSCGDRGALCAERRLRDPREQVTEIRNGHDDGDSRPNDE